MRETGATAANGRCQRRQEDGGEIRDASSLTSRLWLLLSSSLLAVDDEKFVLAVRVAHADADARAEAGDGRARGGRACGGGGGRGRGER